ncbi:class I SAM-dependent methyltransferase [Olivibacter sitiensis]|uniref:class I SAM-dependent methyltransferase n=1 Tax=Olivibacter sitiensis TaxID=376470 RepID=UPI000429B2A2|nr:SAM-dependent methyltransferase [Olivibacter sitiensis]
MSSYQGTLAEMRNIYVREVLIKGSIQLGFTFRYATRDITKNYTRGEGEALVKEYLLGGFSQVRIFTIDRDLAFELKGDGFWRVREFAPSLKKQDIAHDKKKRRLLATSNDKLYLHELGIMDANGQVYKHGQDKYKQINQFLALLKPLLDEVDPTSIHHVVDMGAGKGYLTFALYDFLHTEYNINPDFVGVEYRQELVDLCNKVAESSKFDKLVFRQGGIIDYDGEVDMLIALHACDTATDDAICKAIKGNASLIVVAPCCHKQIRREMENGIKKNELSSLTKYGIFLERQAEMVTDSLRVLIMEYFGYKTKVVQFVSDAHTPKNVMLTGIKQKKEIVESRKAEILAEISALKSYFGISTHYLEQLLALSH